MTAMERKLLNTTDAREWAQAFVATFGDHLGDVDEGLMISWFANAIETGREAGRQGMVDAISSGAA